jgi:hypothetical protein
MVALNLVPMKLLKILLGTLVGLSTTFVLSQEVFLTEGFETHNGIEDPPDGWDNEKVGASPQLWRYRNGGHSPNDISWAIPEGQYDPTRNPKQAYEGTYNAIFFMESYNNERTKLITPPLDMLGATNPELSFYLCQIPWSFLGPPANDFLRVYYRISADDDWVLLHEYLDAVWEWEEQKLSLPNPSETYYVAFEGQTKWGFGTCIDNISIMETGAQPMYIGEIEFEQLFDEYIPSGISDLPVMLVDFKVFGNTDSVILETIHFTSLNTSDGDILSNGVKLYSTSTQTFETSNPLGSPTDFVSGIASFTGLNHTLQTGHSYLWLTYDVDPNATHENILDVMVAASAITANGAPYPDADQSPPEQRVIYKTFYSENFEGTHNWDLTGEFQVGTPAGLGGDPGNPDPEGAFRGSNALGTDLTGLGSNLYNYEPDLDEASAYLATSPSMNALYYKNLNLFYSRHLNIEWLDYASIQISRDDGNTWSTFWENTHLLDYQWLEERLVIPDEYSRSDQFKIRYTLGPTTSYNHFSGWNIDDIYLTGEFISKDVGVSDWILPQSGSGHTASDSVTVRIRNYGGAEIVDPVPVAYSFNGGASWTVNQMSEHIPVGGSVEFTFFTRVDLTEPGLIPSVLAKTTLPGDQFAGNDQISTELYIVPTYSPPYIEDFDNGEGFWRSMGNSIWEYGTPDGAVIDGASSGTKSWATGLSSRYEDLIANDNRTILEDGFEVNKGWVLSGEFERTSPDPFYTPFWASSGYNCIGTDLSGLGANPHQYENGITSGTAHTATSPAIDVTDYTNLRISFWGYIKIQNGDSIKLEVSPDNGSSWVTLWKNSEGEIMETAFQPREYIVPDAYIYTDALKFRFSLFHTSVAGAVAEGWFIDELMITGDLVESEPGTLSSPSFDLTGIVNPMITANLWIDTEQDVDGVTLQYSLDDGDTWTSVTNTSGYDTYWNWYTTKPVVALGLDGWSGQSGGWIPVKHLFPPALVDQDNVQFMFIFAANKTNNQYDGMAVDDVQIMEAPKDLDIIDILDPVSACELSAEQTFTLRARNAGNSALQAGDSLEIGYFIDRSGEIQTAEETFVLTQSWPSGNTLDIPLSTSFDFDKSGEYLTEVYFKTVNPHFYSAVSNDTISRTIEVNKPDVDLGKDISTVRPDTVILKAYSGVPGQTYLWQDGSEDSTFIVETDGTYFVTVTGLGCVASDTVQVLQLVSDVGVSTYLGPLSDCELDNQLTLKIRVENMGTDTVEIGETIFIGGVINETQTFEDTRVLTQRFKPDEAFDYTYSGTFDFSAPGDYEMKLYTRMTGDEVQGNDTLYHTLHTFGYPDSDLGPDTTVLASEYILTPAPGYFEYLWQDGSTGETFTVNQPGVGLYHVTVSDENQCTSYDTVVVTLNVQDLELDQLLEPATSCGLSESITVSARIRNAGNQAIPAGETINMGYRIDEGTIIQEGKVLTQNLLSGHTLDFTFANAESVQTGQWYDFTVFVDYENDSKRWNDTVITSVGVFETPELDLGDDYQLVTGFEHTLDAGPGFASYEWQDGSTSRTYIITAPGINLYSVTVTDANGCTAYDEAQVFLAAPDVGVKEVSHPVTTCHLEDSEHVQVAVQNFGNYDIEPSAEITVAYSINGAPEVSELLVLAETFENGSVISHTFTQVEDFSEPGIYDIMAYTFYESDLIPSNNIVLVSVNHFGSPVVDIGNGSDSILVYEPITLSANPEYPSYEWPKDGSTGTDYSITDPSADWYTVIVTGENGCATHDSVYVAYDRPDLAISRIASPVSSCDLSENTTVSLEILNNGYTSISTRENLTITCIVNGGVQVIEQVQLETELPLGQSRIISFTETYDFSVPGSYEIETNMAYTADQDYSNNFLTGNVEVWEGPSVEIGGGKDMIVSDLPVTLDAGSGYTSYLWQDNSTGSALQATEYGLYWVTVTDENGCQASDSVVVVAQVSTDGHPVSGGEVRIFPNPVEEVLYVALELQVEKEVILELYTITNALVYREDIKRAQVTKAQIDVQDLKPGTYSLRITADGFPHNFLVIVE